MNYWDIYIFYLNTDFESWMAKREERKHIIAMFHHIDYILKTRHHSNCLIIQCLNLCFNVLLFI